MIGIAMTTYNGEKYFMENFTFTGKNGCQIAAAKSVVPQAKGVVQIVHGIAEHKERYEPFCKYLNQNGYSVYLHDHRGHGGSRTEKPGYTTEKNGWKIMVDEIRILSDIIKNENPQLPLFLFGHSMGSFLVRTYAIENSDCLNGLIVCATGGPMPFLSFVGHTVARIQKKLSGGKKTAHFINKLSLGGYSKFYGGNNWLSRDRKTIEDYENDELCGFIPTVALFENLLYGTRFVNARKNIARMRKTLPILLIAGDGDPVGNFGKGVLKVETLFRQAGMNDVECKIYSEARHELLNETNKSEVMSDILNWIELRRETK